MVEKCHHRNIIWNIICARSEAPLRMFSLSPLPAPRKKYVVVVVVGKVRERFR